MMHYVLCSLRLLVHKFLILVMIFPHQVTASHGITELLTNEPALEKSLKPSLGRVFSAYYVKNLKVIYGHSKNVDLSDEEKSNNWYKIPIDLNQDAGGQYVYLCVQYGYGTLVSLDFIREITVEISDTNDPIASTDPNTFFSSVDLNLDAGGKYLYLGWTFGYQGPAIRDIWIVYGDSKNEAMRNIPFGWWYVPIDLNLGAGGDYVYLIYRFW